MCTAFPKPGHLAALHPKGRTDESLRESAGSHGGISPSSWQTEGFATSDLTGSSEAHQEVSLIRRQFEVILGWRILQNREQSGSPPSNFIRPSTRLPGAQAS